MARPETRNWYGVLQDARKRGVSMTTVAEEQNVEREAVAKACRRHLIALPDGRATRWNGKSLLRRELLAPE